MNYGLWLSASAMQANTWRQDVYANNLANASTVAFKRDLANLRQRDPEAIASGQIDARHDLLDKLSGGVLAGPQSISFAPGPMQRTGVPTDIALDQNDTFLAVQHRDPATNALSVRLTRDGRLSRNAAGDLVLAASGHRVLDVNDQPITLAADAPFSIRSDGFILQNGEEIAQMQVTGVTDLNLLVKQGSNLFAFKEAGDFRRPVPGATVRPEHVEASGVDPIKALLELVAATKAISSNGNLIRYHDTLMDRAVNVLGRVA